MTRKTYNRVLVSMLLLAGCAAEPPKASDGENGISGADAGAGSTGFGNGNGNGNTTGPVAGTGAALADGGSCPLGEVCAPTTPDPNNCGTFTLEGDITKVETPGNVLIVFDRSSSMNTDWNGMPRWQAAGGAMIAALTPLQDKLTIGTVFFPDNKAGLLGTPACTVDPFTATDQIAFVPGAMALTKMQAPAPSGTPTPLYAPSATGTPTLEGLQVADAALATATLTGTTSVILVTDGDPNCAWNQATAIGIVAAWLGKGIKTYVLGVPGVGGGGVATLNAVAAAGGTMQYIPPTDATSLQQTIQGIVEKTISSGIDSCTITFDPPAQTPDELTLAVTENAIEAAVPHTYPNGTAAWTISPDGSTVELLDDTCAAAKNGTYTSLRFVFGCDELPPADPPPLVD